MYIIFRFTNDFLFTAVALCKEHFMHSIEQRPPVGQGLFIVALGRTPWDQHSTRSRDLYLTTHNTLTRHKSMPSAGFEPAFHQAIGLRPRGHWVRRFLH